MHYCGKENRTPKKRQHHHQKSWWDKASSSHSLSISQNLIFFFFPSRGGKILYTHQKEAKIEDEAHRLSFEMILEKYHRYQFSLSSSLSCRRIRIYTTFLWHLSAGILKLIARLQCYVCVSSCPAPPSPGPEPEEPREKAQVLLVWWWCCWSGMETVDKTLLKAFPTTFSHESDECGLLLFTHQCKLCSPIQPKYAVYDEYICVRVVLLVGW